MSRSEKYSGRDKRDFSEFGTVQQDPSFDEYFGSPMADPVLGQIVTAYVFGAAHLGYIVNITWVSVTLVSVDTLSVLPRVGRDDIYSGEYSPFFHNHLKSEYIYHPQHVISWWSKFIQRRQCVDFSHLDNVSSFPMCDDATSDWPVGEETWFSHNALSQRSQFVQRTKEEVLCIPTKNATGHTEPTVISLPDSSLVLTGQP